MTSETIDFVACQSFAGGFDMGATRAGLRMVHKVEMKGGFGIPNCVANRELLGDQWDWQAVPPEEWERVEAPVLIGNPPCSGFSLLSHKDFRGQDSAINDCMWAFADYVVKQEPLIAVFESVQQAYRQGLELMRNLRYKVETETGMRWDLYHVLHNNASVGGAAIRRRYFWVISRVPFGIEREPVIKVPTLDDVIGDLEGLGRSWERQPYRRPATWWSDDLRSPSGSVDGQFWRMTPYLTRAIDLIPGAGPWLTKEIISDVARRHHGLHGCLPESWANTEAKLIETDFKMGYNQLIRWDATKMARVITGGGLDLVMHPHEDRTLTHREVARIQGFPDDWRIRPLRGSAGLQLTWGKGIPVHCGRWIGHWVKEAVLGRPGAHVGVPGEQEREWIINTTEDYRQASKER